MNTIKNFHRLWSMWAAAVVALLAIVEPMWPALEKLLPPGWAAYGVLLIAVLRAIPQKLPEVPEPKATGRVEERE